MGAVERRPALRAQGTVQFTNISRIDAVLGGVFDKISSLEYLDKLYQSLPQATGETEFLRHVLDVFHIDYELRAIDLTRIPCNGPAIVVANHPFGAIEGVILAHILLKVRSDVRIMANPLLGRVREI
jgi:putative hemolysin